VPPSSIDDTLTDAVELALADYLTIRQSTMAAHADSLGLALRALTEFVLGGGKRLRPTFAWWGWRSAGGPADGDLALAALRAVSSLELIQACALVHDDVMDESAVRRGAPTVHVAFTDLHRDQRWHGVPEQFGLAAAILLGDIALASEMLAGQYLDVLTQATADESAEAALGVARLKTAAYTVERPLHIGAALGGADEDTIRRLRSFGADIGVAFQLRDDLLGVFGDPRVTGKPAGDDLREGKRTLLVAEGLRLAREQNRAADVALLRDGLGASALTEADIERVRTTLVELGAVSEVERRIAELTESAMAALRSAELAPPSATKLAELAIAATRRSH
jgi:geranylgeranyl diphosphate synthase type I